MNARIHLIVTVSMLLFVASAGAQQFPVVDKIADKIIQKYEQSTCEQLWQKKSQPKSELEERAIHLLRTDPAMRAELINKVAAPIANKLFECGMIP